MSSASCTLTGFYCTRGQCMMVICWWRAADGSDERALRESRTSCWATCKLTSLPSPLLPAALFSWHAWPQPSSQHLTLSYVILPFNWRVIVDTGECYCREAWPWRPGARCDTPSANYLGICAHVHVLVQPEHSRLNVTGCFKPAVHMYTRMYKD